MQIRLYCCLQAATGTHICNGAFSIFLILEKCCFNMDYLHKKYKNNLPPTISKLTTF